jgi:hypothetical protein
MRRPVRPTSQPISYPAPLGGLNTSSSGAALPPGDCVSVVNLMAAENGLRSRIGFREWATGLTGSIDEEVRTLLSFSGSEPSQNRLFSVTSSAIFDVSSSTTTPAPDYSFITTSGDAGYGVGRVFVTAGGHFLTYCDEVNGLVVYSESGTTWTAPAQGAGATEIDNVDPGDLVHVTAFKGRLWFTERDSSSAWYLPPGQVYGAATEFDFGTQFKSGGHLVGLWNWTYDGGAGLDDSLVAISSAGDVVIYQGTDPSDASTFGLRGVWQMGPPPAGRRIVRDVGGDLYLLSTLGILPISRLVVGAESKAYATEKVSNLFNGLMLARKDLPGWAMVQHPEDNALLVLLPDYSDEESQQLAQALGSPQRGWFRYEGLPMLSGEVWEKQLYFGTRDGRVCVATGYVDEVTLAAPDDFTPVDWSLLTSFQSAPGGLNAQVKSIRTHFVSDGARPTFGVNARYDYDDSEFPAPSASPAEGESLWGTMVWGEDPWGGSARAYTITRGATGVGHTAALAIRGKSASRTILVGLEAIVESGGWL